MSPTCHTAVASTAVPVRAGEFQEGRWGDLGLKMADLGPGPISLSPISLAEARDTEQDHGSLLTVSE